MRLSTTVFAKEDRWWTRQETDSGRHYLAIPVFNMVDYAEIYWFTAPDADDHRASLVVADTCWRRDHDDLLIYPPRDRIEEHHGHEQ